MVQEGSETRARPAWLDWMAHVRRVRRSNWKIEKEESGVGNFDEEGMIDHSVLEDTEGSGAVEFVDEKQSR